MLHRFLIPVLALAFSVSAGQTTGLKGLSDSFSSVAKAVNPAVVTIATDQRLNPEDTPFNHPFFDDEFFRRHFNVPEEGFRSTALGSGVIVDAGKGYLLTNNHVVENAEEIRVVLMDEREFDAEIVGRDEASDLAVLKIKAEGLVEAPLGDSDALRVGDWVVAIGSPFSAELSHTVTAGIVSAKGRNRVIGGVGYEDFIQTDAAINPGNSGGALVNLEGRLVGINTAIVTGGFSRGNVGIGFAIPVNLAKRVMEDLIAEGRVIRSWLGVYIQDVNDALAKALDLTDREGVIVTQIMEDSPAETAGIEVEDVVLTLNGTKIRNSAHLKNVVSSIRPGARAEVGLIRGKDRMTLSVVLKELPSDQKMASAGKKEATSKLGLRVEALTAQLARQYRLEREDAGVVVVSVSPQSNAAKAGLHTGDLIRRVGDTVVASPEEFRSAVRSHEGGGTLLFLVKREGGSLFIPVSLN